jgi:acyl-CoA thioester hydrolase/carnitine 3-dehydrogenase
MTEYRYLQVFGDSSDSFYRELGVNFERASDGAFYTLETHIRHIAEVRVGTAVWTETEILGYDEKRLHLLHRLYEAGSHLLATGEHLTIHVANSEVCPASQEMLSVIERVLESQKDLPLPERVGSVLKKPLANTRLLHL